jgi:malate synthase
MPAPHQIDRLRKDVHVTATDLLKVPAGTITEPGMRTNISVGIQYMANWLSGLGCVPLYNLMEDAATAEISRAQLWQWINHPDAALDDGRKITLDLFRSMMKEEMEKIKAEVGAAQFQQVKYEQAATLFDEIIAADNLAEFLTLKAYDHLEG